MNRTSSTATLGRRQLIAAMATGLATATLPALATKPSKIAVEVWKDPNCGCCKDWISYMEDNGFSVTVHDTGLADVRARLKLPNRILSCHTALVDGYVVEGHVPASDVKKLLQAKPKAIGIAVPGMPVGSPGMDGEVYGGRKDPYDVVLVTRNLMNSDVSTSVFTSYR